MPEEGEIGLFDAAMMALFSFCVILMALASGNLAYLFAIPVAAIGIVLIRRWERKLREELGE